MDKAKSKITGLRAKSAVSTVNKDPKSAITSLRAKGAVNFPAPKGKMPKSKIK